MDVPLLRVLLVCLDLYNEWCADLSLLGNWRQHKSVTEKAEKVASRLQRRCNPQNMYRAENKAVARHFFHRALALEDTEPAQAFHFYEEARNWRYEHPDMDDLLTRTRVAAIQQEVQACALKQQYEEAYRLIDEAEVHLPQNGALSQLRMRICFRHARELESQEKYTEAWGRGRQALALAQDNVVLQEFVAKMSELIPEEGHKQALQMAELARAEADFALALQQLARIAPGSRYHQQAQELKKQVQTQQEESRLRDRQAAESRETPAEKEERLRAMLEKSEVTQGRPQAREELSGLLVKQAKDEFEVVQKARKDLSESTRRSRLIYIRSLLDEALELDARSRPASELLAQVVALLENKGSEKKQGGKS
jgi:hypothetical protein